MNIGNQIKVDSHMVSMANAAIDLRIKHENHEIEKRIKSLQIQMQAIQINSAGMDLQQKKASLRSFQNSINSFNQQRRAVAHKFKNYRRAMRNTFKILTPAMVSDISQTWTSIIWMMKHTSNGIDPIAHEARYKKHYRSAKQGNQGSPVAGYSAIENAQDCKRLLRFPISGTPAHIEWMRVVGNMMQAAELNIEAIEESLWELRQGIFDTWHPEELMKIKVG